MQLLYAAMEFAMRGLHALLSQHRLQPLGMSVGGGVPLCHIKQPQPFSR
jgi:hypothetical protein